MNNLTSRNRLTLKALLLFELPAAAPPTVCPEGYFHHWNDTSQPCVCYEPHAAYYGNNHKFGDENRQPDRLACQQSCAVHPECKFWTFRVPSKDEDQGYCYLKTKRGNLVVNITEYTSGTKNCPLPETKG